ncbi:unnamed protein product [Symbiodinium sp. CCMP2456]|nr:unnamed protein product [Symbiodinium sp. CCMP2456]
MPLAHSSSQCLSMPLAHSSSQLLCARQVGVVLRQSSVLDHSMDTYLDSSHPDTAEARAVSRVVAELIGVQLSREIVRWVRCFLSLGKAKARISLCGHQRWLDRPGDAHRRCPQEHTSRGPQEKMQTLVAGAQDEQSFTGSRLCADAQSHSTTSCRLRFSASWPIALTKS